MEKLLEFLSGFNIQTILSMVLVMWYFARHIEDKMDQNSARTDKLYEMFIEHRKEVDQKFYDMLKEGRK